MCSLLLSMSLMQCVQGCPQPGCQQHKCPDCSSCKGPGRRCRRCRSPSSSSGTPKQLPHSSSGSKCRPCRQQRTGRPFSELQQRSSDPSASPGPAHPCGQCSGSSSGGWRQRQHARQRPVLAASAEPRAALCAICWRLWQHFGQSYGQRGQLPQHAHDAWALRAPGDVAQAHLGDVSGCGV